MSVAPFGQRLLAISGSFPDGTFSVERLSGREGLGQCFAFEVTLLSDSPNVDISKLIGDTVTVTIDRGISDPRFIHGFVTRAALVGTFDRHARYTIHVAPWLFLLSGRVNNRIFQKQSVPAIAKALFREHGFADFEDQLSGDYPDREFVVQHRESDLAFVSRLLEKVGIYYFFRHEEGRHVLVLADSPSAHKTVPGSEIVPFHPEGSSTPIAGEQINRWEVVMQWRVNSVTSSDFDFERPRADLTARAQVTSPFKQSELEVFDFPAGYTKQSDVDAFVRARLIGIIGDAVTSTASGDVQGLGAG
ncbi:MAG TPA: type VI secretion system tip protein TssI/VgrG, partial [Polyangia bacterium]|nr:type VI secretion system tip protein TssI/VgrG [Polyangia bacterium]